MPERTPGPSVKDDELYEELRDDGASKEKAARIANAAANSSRSEVGRRGGESGSYDDWSVDELRERTARMEASGVPVCWVTDRERPWIGAVPAIRLSLADESGPPVAVDAKVVDGTGVFREAWCPRRRCENDGGAPGPCPGHGWWRPVEPDVDLSVFVAGVLAGTIRAHRTPRYSRFFLESARIVWTTRPHVITERAPAGSQRAPP